MKYSAIYKIRLVAKPKSNKKYFWVLFFKNIPEIIITEPIVNLIPKVASGPRFKTLVGR